MRVAAGSRPGDRELPPVTPRPSVRLVVPLLFASLPPLPPVLSPLPFFPRSRNNFVKSARRRRNDEGGTTALRGGLYTSLARPQAPRPSNSLSMPFSISRVKPPPAVLLSHPPAASRRTRQVCPSSLFSACALRSLPVSPPLALPFPLSFLFLSRARSISYSCLLCASRSARSLARSSAPRSRLFGRRIDASRRRGRYSLPCLRSLARLPAIIVVFFVGTSAHSYPLARVLSQDER